MYDILTYYSIFALSTGITTYLTVFRPILKKLGELDLDFSRVPEVRDPIRTAIVIIGVSTFFAPLMIFQALTGPTVEFTEKYLTKILPDDI